MKLARNALALLIATLREIFDESAYARFLVRNHQVVSRHSYDEFLREIEVKKRTAPKCC